jgi:hypothetical protein
MGPSFQENLSFLPQMCSYGLGKLVKPYFAKANRLKISNMYTLTFPKVENFIDAKFYKLKLNPFIKVPSFLRNENQSPTYKIQLYTKISTNFYNLTLRIQTCF